MMPKTSGKFRWALLLCKPGPEEPISPAYFSNFICGKGTGSISDFWNDMSCHNLDMSDCTIYGWYTVPFIMDDSFLNMSRYDKVEKCKVEVMKQLLEAHQPAAFHTEVISDFNYHDGYMVLLGQNRGGSGHAGGSDVLLDMNALRHTYVAHETGHALGLEHSFDTNPVPWDPDNDIRPGAYGEMTDIMSAEAFGRKSVTYTGPYANTGPGLNAPTRESLGWLPAARVTTYEAHPNSNFAVQYFIGALNSPEVEFNLMVRIKAIGFAPMPDVEYYLEYRPKQGWDAGFPSDGVVIHKLTKGDRLRAVWASADSQLWDAGSLFIDTARQLAVSIDEFDSSKSFAKLYIQGGKKVSPEEPISVRHTLAHKALVIDGRLKSVDPGPRARGSVRELMIAYPPQLP